MKVSFDYGEAVRMVFGIDGKEKSSFVGRRDMRKGTKRDDAPGRPSDERDYGSSGRCRKPAP